MLKRVFGHVPRFLKIIFFAFCGVVFFSPLTSNVVMAQSSGDKAGQDQGDWRLLPDAPPNRWGDLDLANVLPALEAEWFAANCDETLSQPLLEAAERVINKESGKESFARAKDWLLRGAELSHPDLVERCAVMKRQISAWHY